MAEPRCWGLVPAAGVGARMGADRPKQYLPLAGSTVIEHTLRRLCGHARIAGVVVCIADGDPHWARLRDNLPAPLETAPGGAQRADSVLSGLEVLCRHAQADDWVLVHDAVRPCVRADDIDALIDAALPHPDGALLAMPVSDTLKRVDAEGRVLETVPREGLWRAATPQMFPLGRLAAALRAAREAGVDVTDEAGAMERLGAKPRVVACAPDNIKITHPQDLALAEAYLRSSEDRLVT